MIIDPKVAIEKGWITFPVLPMDKNQLQPNGIDLRLKHTIKIPDLNFSMERNKTHNSLYKKHWYDKEIAKESNKKIFKLSKLIAYSVESYEYIQVPENVMALIYGRSTLNRNGILIRSSIYDSGFKNFVGFTIYPFVPLKIEQATRIAQIIFVEAASSSLYNGQYQNLSERS